MLIVVSVVPTEEQEVRESPLNDAKTRKGKEIQ